MELLFLQPIFKERIWGGSQLQSEFGYLTPSEHTGEAWIISAHKNGETTIKNGKYAGQLLSKVWQDHPELFANDYPREFPLLVKILDASTDLSVQVHPNDEYAIKVEKDLGKRECWYVLDAKPGAKIIYGHTAKTIDEFRQLALNNKWANLLKYTPVKNGDFFDVPTGTVHALGAGNLILEVQQSSDTTYRLYDYDRLDDQGQLRELHLDKAFAVVNIPHQNQLSQLASTNLNDNGILTNLTSNQYFTVQKLVVDGNAIYPKLAKYLLVCVINGNGSINEQLVTKGDAFIVPYPVQELNIQGQIELIITYETN